MNKNKYKWAALILLLLGSAGSIKASQSGLTDGLRGNAKFNVVAVVLGIIFAGLAFFLIRLDKRVTNLEDKLNNNKS